MQQYRDIKARYPQTILFFRMGDFYEMFEDDARLAARELGLTLTTRNNGGAAEVPLAGVPVKAAAEYLRRLIGKGHRVAICEQVEDPKLAKGLVRREVVETVTPGSVLADDWVAQKRNNFLVAVEPRGGAPGLAALDLTTGEFVLELVEPQDLSAALARYEPLEVLLPAGTHCPLPDGATVTEREAWEFDPELAREDLLRSFRLASLDGLGVAAAGRAALGRATPRELGALRDSIRRLPDARAALDGVEGRERAALLEQAADRFELLQDLGDELARALVDRPPAQLADGDAIRPGHDRALDDLKDARDGGKQYIASLQARERERTGIPSLKVGFNKVFGYYIAVTNPHKARVPPDYERRQTLTGAERYVTPELKEYEAKVLGAEERIAAREAELVDALRRVVAAAIGRIQETAGLLAGLDVWAALADLAHRDAYVRPEVNDAFVIHLEGSRHPVVERMMPREAFIPNDVLLDEAARVVLLTGPNMAGKSTLLRQVGLCVLLAQMGAFVPARRAVVGVVDRLFTRVGASDNLARGQSTFMVEMSETSAIPRGASARSLVPLDEIGRGTSTYDGVAIAWAVTEFLHNTIGGKTIFATHYHELTQLTEELAHARNFNVAVREVGDEIVFLHRLEPGGADRSYGIHVGRLAGLPTPVVARAWQVLQLLEAGHHVPRQPAPPPPDAAPLGLFGPVAPPPPHPLVTELGELDVNTLSPLEALNRLAAWKKQLEERT